MQSDDATICQYRKNSGRSNDPDFVKRRVDQRLRLAGERHWGRGALGEEVPQKGAVVMQSNDYLSLAGDHRVARAKADALLAHGHGDAISRVFTHHRHDAHRAFEQRVANLMQAEDAVLCTSGYTANVGLVQAFAEKDMPVYLDIKAHASLWEGVSSARARFMPFRHNDARDLGRKVKHYGPGLVVVDALYSTDGNMCPLDEIVAAAESGGCAIVVDETHSFGCQGPDGAGLVVEFGLQDRVHFRTVGLSKAMAARGGIVVGSARNMEYYRYESFPMIFSTTVLGYEIAGFEKTLDIIQSEPWRREQLAINQRFLKDGLLDLGYDVKDCDRQIVAIPTGTLEDTVIFRRALARRGVHGSVFCVPATRKNQALIRFTINCALTAEQLDHVVNACADIRRHIDIGGVRRSDKARPAAPATPKIVPSRVKGQLVTTAGTA